MAIAAPDRLHYTPSDEANALIATDPLALLIGFALDQQVPLQTAFAGPLKIKQRLGTLSVAQMDPSKVGAAFREKPAVHRFPGVMATRVQDLCALVEEEYDGDASRLWREATDSADLKRRIEALPGFGQMKVIALGSVLAKRFGVEAAQGLVPSHPTIGDVDSPEALESYQEKKRAHKAKMRAERQG
ncbi:MAG: HhH-GPD-type base excision DNA repair protein [Actinomycetota bacterium]